MTASAGVPDLEVRHEDSAERFVGYRDGQPVGLVDYRRDGDMLVVVHTETAPALRGQGIAADLTRGIIAHVEAAGLRIRPVCPYTVRFLDEHPEYAHLRA